LLLKVREFYLLPLQDIGYNNAYRLVFLGYGHHSLDAFGKNPVIRKDRFAILAGRRDLTKRRIVVGNYRQELLVVVNANPGVARGRPGLDFHRPVLAAVIGDDVFPILVGLRKRYTMLDKIFLAVVHQRQINQGL
jgi:hypothetical protein